MPYGIPPYGVDKYGNPDDPEPGDLLFVELPGVYVDSLIFDEVSAGLYLFNAIPTDGSVDNPRTTNVDFDLFETSGSTVDVSTLNVSVNGIPAIIDGVIQAPFDGGDAVIVDDGANVHVTLDFTDDYESEEIIEVVVVCSNAANTFELDTQYQFKIEDFTPPILLEASAMSEKIVRLTFNESMMQVDPAAENDALNPANYAFEALTVPAVPIVAVSVASVSGAVIDITLDTEMTMNATYKVTVSNAEDVSENEILPPDNDAEFGGYVCDRPLDRDFDLWNFVPPVLKGMDEGNGDFRLWIKCLQEVVDLLLCEIDHFTDLADPDLAPEAAVDAMLVDLGNPFKFELSLDEKKKLVKTLVPIYQQKGTGIGIENVINFFMGLEVEVVPLNAPAEIWELGIDELGFDTYLGPSDLYLLYSFKIVSPINLTDKQIKMIVDIANYMKPAHTHLIAIETPEEPIFIDDWELGLSELGEGTDLH